MNDPVEVSKVDSVMEAENELIQKMVRVVGYVPTGTKDLLHVLMHPDVLSSMEKYVSRWKAEADYYESIPNPDNGLS